MEEGLEERRAVSQLKNHLKEIIEIEWDIINDLKKELAKTTETTKITRLSNSIALHAATLNKLLQAQRNETITDETTLEQLIAKLPKKYRTKFHRRIKKCKNS
jgi:molybdopterin converting factor small subunit